MSNQTLFYICGIALAVSAVSVSFLGLKVRSFPGRAMPLVVLWFALLVGASTTFAVLHGKDEDKARAAELQKAGTEIENAQGSAPYENEGAEGGESEQAEQEVEGEAEGGSQEEKSSSSGGPPQGAAKKGAASQVASTTLQLAASKTALAFDTSELSAKAGKVTIDFENPSAIEHDVAIAKGGKQLAVSEKITEGNTSVSAELQPGTYTFLCTVPGHAAAGMEGTLVVK